MSSPRTILATSALFCLLFISSAFAEQMVSTEGELRSIMSEYQDSIAKSLLETQRTVTARIDALENRTATTLVENQAIVIDRVKSQELKFLSMFTSFALFFVCGVGLVWSVLLGTKWYSYRRYKKQVLEENKEEFIDLAAKKYKKEMNGKIAFDVGQKYLEFMMIDPSAFVEEHPEFAKKIGLIWMKNRVKEEQSLPQAAKNEDFDKFWRQK